MRSDHDPRHRHAWGSASRIFAAVAALALGSALLLAGCAASTATLPPAPTAEPTQAVTGAPAGTAATGATAVPATPVVAATSAIAFVPATFSCSDATTPVGITWTLTGNLTGDTQILYEWDGSLGQGGQMPQALTDAGFSQQSDGSWQQAQNSTGADLCQNLGLSTGSHTWTVMKAQSDGTPGAVLAQGSFTVTQ
jgi:hypothetical protein